MDALFDKGAYLLSGGVVTGDQLKLVVSILSSYFFAMFYRNLEKPTVKHLYSITIALFTTLIVLKLYIGFLHISLTSLFSYIWMKYDHSYRGPWINFIFVMISMSICHIDRQLKGNSGDTTLDYSGMMMIATIKLTMYGFNIWDGRNDKKLPLTDYNNQMKISQYPSVLEFSGWMLFFGGYLVGPACEFMDYLRFVHESQKDKQKRPSSLIPTLTIIAKSLISITILLSCSSKYNFSSMLKPEWQAHSFLKKLLFIQIVAFVTRCKYYTVWFLSEGACVLCGFGFNGYDQKGKPLWDRVTNINAVHIELAQSLKEYSDNWNMSANKWLKNYVYLRVTPPNKKAGLKSTLTTYAVSAFWHGFYPGYYIMFLSLALFQNVGRMSRRLIRPFMLNDKNQSMMLRKSVYDVLGVISTAFIVNTMSISFIGLYLHPILLVWKNIYFIHYILGLLVFILLKLAYSSLLKLQKKRAQQFGYKSKIVTPPSTPKAIDMDVTDLTGAQPPEVDPKIIKKTN
ncbi:MBOAT, membrane-bound O-acyltransferase family-domain-containing protein [Cunninghamella echinulata]|nr:MBOAT, membrane-bound O-acyltransferase family-domain-containing protein [Cunninghamella echinulata]